MARTRDVTYKKIVIAGISKFYHTDPQNLEYKYLRKTSRAE